MLGLLWALRVHAKHQEEIKIKETISESKNLQVKPESAIEVVPQAKANYKGATKAPTAGGIISGGSTVGQHPYSKEDVENLIREHSVSFGLDPSLPLRIAKCESGFRWDAKNKSSTASGVFQYLKGTWANTSEGKKGTSVFDADANIRMAVASIATSGTAPWNASIGCWKR